MVCIYSLSNVHDIIGHKWVYEFTALLSEYEKTHKLQTPYKMGGI